MPPAPEDHPSGTDDRPLLDPASPAMKSLFVQGSAPVNLALIVGSVLLTIWTGFGADRFRLLPWLISLYPPHSPDWLAEVRHGQIWRLLTPMFLHFSIAHIAFNLLNMLTLGKVIERRIGSLDYLAGTLVVSLVSNLTQYFIGGSVAFGGMSGVVYGLFGYVWLRARVDRTFGLAMPNQTILIALAWFVLCFTNFGGALPIANWAHTGGLALGCLWGVIDGRTAMRRARLTTDFTARSGEVHGG